VVYSLLIVVAFGAAWKPFEITTDFGVFARADGESMMQRDALILAHGKQEGLSARRRLEAQAVAEASSGGRQLSQNSHYMTRHISVYYRPKAGNALDERVLREIRAFERRLRGMEAWKQMCYERVTFDVKEQWLCDPGESMASIAYPTQAKVANTPGVSFKFKFDGNGVEPLRAGALLQYMDNAYNHLKDTSRELKRYLPKAFAEEYHLHQSLSPPPAAIRSTFTFKILFGLGVVDIKEVKAELKKVGADWKAFVADHVYPLLRSTADSEEYEHIDIYYAGGGLAEIEVVQTLYSDILLAIGSILFVSLYMWLHIRSLLISIGCFFIIFSSVPLAYVMTPLAETTIATFLSLFLVTVIDIDVIFIFNDFWDQSVNYRKTTESRLVWMMLRGGKSCLATSLTTSLSFFANLASCLQPLREFGLFMVYL
jgi:hypothetical protein